MKRRISSKENVIVEDIRSTVEQKDDNICTECKHSGLINLDLVSCNTLFK